MSSSRTLSRKFRTFFTCIKPRFDPSIILLYIAASVEQYCDITQVNALPENEGILEMAQASPHFCAWEVCLLDPGALNISATEATMKTNMIDGQKRGFMQFQDVRAFLDSILDEDIHTKRVDSLANATLGIMTGASLGVAIIGKSLAQARGLLPKHAIKQVDRLLSNRKLEAWDIFATWVPELVGSPTDLSVAMDWTDFAADGPLALKLVTRHGRATPLVWLSVLKDELKDARNGRGQKPRQSFICNRYRCSGRVADWLGSLGYSSF